MLPSSFLFLERRVHHLHATKRSHSSRRCKTAQKCLKLQNCNNRPCKAKGETRPSFLSYKTIQKVRAQNQLQHQEMKSFSSKNNVSSSWFSWKNFYWLFKRKISIILLTDFKANTGHERHVKHSLAYIKWTSEYPSDTVSSFPFYCPNICSSLIETHFLKIIHFHSYMKKTKKLM